MSAETLRRAASQMREDASRVRRPFARQEKVAVAVADWLDACADSCPPPEFKQPTLALRVAHAYLEDQP